MAVTAVLGSSPYVPVRPRVPEQAPAWHAAADSDWSAEDLCLVAMFAEGLPVEAIARRLNLSDRTIRRRSRAMCDRLGVKATVQVVAWAARNRLI